MYKIHCLNNIAPAGLEALGTNCELTENLAEAEAVLVRSASMHELEVGDNLRAVGRAGAGTNNIPVDEYARRGIVVFNTPGANANGVKELVLCGMLIASRDVIGGVEWTQSIPEGESVAKDVEKGIVDVIAVAEIKEYPAPVKSARLVDGTPLTVNGNEIGGVPFKKNEPAEILVSLDYRDYLSLEVECYEHQ